MSQTLMASAVAHGNTIKLHALSESERLTLPISSYRLTDGRHQVISEYKDMTWRYEDARFTSSTKDSKKSYALGRCPSAFFLR